MNGRNLVLLALGSLLYFALPGSEACAQAGRNWSPARPRFSPNFGYFQTNTTGIPNYYAFVRPAQQYQDFLLADRYQAARAVAETNERHRLETNRLVDSIDRRLSVRTSTGIGAPSVAGSYQDLSHYYRAPQTVRRR